MGLQRSQWRQSKRPQSDPKLVGAISIAKQLEMFQLIRYLQECLVEYECRLEESDLISLKN